MTTEHGKQRTRMHVDRLTARLSAMTAERDALKVGGAAAIYPVSEAAIYAALVEVLGQPVDRSEVLLSRIAIAIKKHSEAK